MIWTAYASAKAHCLVEMRLLLIVSNENGIGTLLRACESATRTCLEYAVTRADSSVGMIGRRFRVQRGERDILAAHRLAFKIRFRAGRHECSRHW